MDMFCIHCIHKKVIKAGAWADFYWGCIELERKPCILVTWDRLVQRTEDLRWNKLIRKCMFFNAVDDIGRPSFSLALWRKVTKVGTFSVSEVAISYIPISIFEKRADMMALKNPNDNRHSRTPPIYIFWAKCWQHMFWYTNEVIYVLSVGRKSWEHMFQFLH